MSVQQYEDITISDLCDSMGIPRKSFYRYFSGKEGALYALIDHTLAEFSGEFFSQELSATLGTLERFFVFWKSHSDLLSALARSNLSGILAYRSVTLAQENGLIARGLLPFQGNNAREYATTFLVSGLISMVLQWHHGGFRESPRELALTAAKLLTRQLLSPSSV